MTDLNDLLASFGGIRPVDGDHFIPVPERELQTIERRLGARLPETYRVFLGTYGASMPRQLVMFCPVEPLPPHISTSGKAYIGVFYGTRGPVDDAYSLQGRLAHFSHRIPSNMIPIADDAGGNQILLGIQGREAGRAFYWDQQTEPLDEEDYLEKYGRPRPPEATFQNVHLIANSFEDLLGRLERTD